MASNKGFELQIKNNANNYITLYPHTSKNQVIGWNVGEISNKYILKLKADSWKKLRQIKQVVDLQGVSSTDKIYCLVILSGTKEEMLSQRENYNLIKSVNSLANKLEFECSEIPTVDFWVQVWWTK